MPKSGLGSSSSSTTSSSNSSTSSILYVTEFNICIFNICRCDFFSFFYIYISKTSYEL